MGKRISLNAFEITAPGHQWPGIWRHPESRGHQYNSLDYWVDMAQTLERGKFDAMFIADVAGLYDVYKNSPDPSLADGMQVPINDPFMQVSAMAAATKNLAFAVTSSVTLDNPYALARKFSSLDHLTNGRVGWNVVSSYLESAAKNFGLTSQIPHDERYEIAEEFMDVAYKLWEGSWEDDAVRIDTEHGVYTDPSKVHPIGHAGKYFNVPGMHLCEPSAQRTPAIFQAGASPRGRDFAAKHGEGIFIHAMKPSLGRKVADDIRDRAERFGRSRDSVKIYTILSVVVGETDAEAQRKFEDYRRYASTDGAMAMFGGWTGIDLSKYDPDQVLKYVETDAVRTILHMVTKADPEREWTAREVAEYLSTGGMEPVLVGTPERIADEIERWVDESGTDGINLARSVTPASFKDFVDMVVPELQKRGRVWKDYEGSTLREYLQGPGNSRVQATHPAAAYTNAYTEGPSAGNPALLV
ncbi:LLM class flavin-dependent oxidoreductase [Citricoccus sp. NPDC055426]|uniref:LLM class flavin-dependent oxidoreductase n=1 Tax=Citricoccus sp. NPDC055426 TaxID=3155536 RepID=UPI0034206708